MRTCNSSSDVVNGGTVAPFFCAVSDGRRRFLTNDVTRFGLKAVILDFNRARLMGGFLPARFPTRLAVAGFAGDRSALLRFDCLAKGYSVKVSDGRFDTAPV